MAHAPGIEAYAIGIIQFMRLTENIENMHQQIFKSAELTKRSILQKVFRQHPTENALFELNNLLALRPVLEIEEREINQIESKYNLSLTKEFKLNLEEFYAVYLNFFLKDQILDVNEQSAGIFWFFLLGPVRLPAVVIFAF